MCHCEGTECPLQLAQGRLRNPTVLRSPRNGEIATPSLRSGLRLIWSLAMTAPHRFSGLPSRASKLGHYLTRQLNHPSLPVSSASKVMTRKTETLRSALRRPDAAAKQH